MAYFQERPFGQDFTDSQIAQLTCLMANVYRGKGEPAKKLADFLPDMKSGEQSPEDIRTALKGILSVYG